MMFKKCFITILFLVFILLNGCNANESNNIETDVTYYILKNRERSPDIYCINGFQYLEVNGYHSRNLIPIYDSTSLNYIKLLTCPKNKSKQKE